MAKTKPEPKATEEHKNLSVERVLAQFQKEEASSAHRKGSFEIDAPFEKALNTILKVRPQAKQKPTRDRKVERIHAENSQN